MSTRWLGNDLNLFVFREATKGLDPLGACRRPLVNAASLPRGTRPTCGQPRLIAAAWPRLQPGMSAVRVGPP